MSFFLYSRQIFTARKISRYVLYAFIPALLFYVVALLILSKLGFEVMEILRDPAQQLEQSSFLGFLSNISVFLWVSSVAVCFFSTSISSSITNYKHKELLFLVGTLAMFLAIDDFFMIHDRYINQNLCYLTYAFLACSILARHFEKIIKIDGFTFFSAGLLLALSIFTDLITIFLPLTYAHSQIFEEGFKFVGAATWLYFSYRIASFHLTEK